MGGDFLKDGNMDVVPINFKFRKMGEGRPLYNAILSSGLLRVCETPAKFSQETKRSESPAVLEKSCPALSLCSSSWGWGSLDSTDILHTI